MLAAMAAVAVIARRMIGGIAFALAIALLACAGSAKGMWQPLRIDHHGWQLAMLAWAAAALTDPKRARGGATLGIATALSLAIGLEMLLYLAAAGAITVLMWIRSGEEARRLLAYGVALGGRLRPRLPGLRLGGQSRAGLRRLVAGLAVGDGRRPARSPSCWPG